MRQTPDEHPAAHMSKNDKLLLCLQFSRRIFILKNLTLILKFGGRTTSAQLRELARVHGRVVAPDAPDAPDALIRELPNARLP